MVERWRQLPLDRALSYAGQVRAFVQGLADEVAEANRTTGWGDGSVGATDLLVPDLGPATLIDQLTVMVHDASASRAVTSPEVRSRTGGLEASRAVTSPLAKELARLRGELR